MRPAPIPDDELQREADRVEDIEYMQSKLSCQELAGTVADGQLAKVLARLGAAIDKQERESQTDTQPLMDSYIIEEKRSWPRRPTL